MNRLSLIFLTGILCIACPAYPETSLKVQVNKLKSEIEELKHALLEQQKIISKLEVTNGISSAAENPASASPPSQASTAISTGAQTRPSGSYIPDIGVVADVVGTSTERNSDIDGNDRLSLRELELIFSHDIDPYSTLNVVATMSDQEDPDIEEANITYFGLPDGIKARIGRMRPRIGKASGTHRDALETVDEPLVVQRYFGKEGLFKTGLELSAFTPLSGDSYTQEFVIGALEGGVGDGGDLFNDQGRHPTLYGHLANFFELADVDSLELGGTYLAGSENKDSQFGSRALGLDLTYSHFFNAVNKLKILGESYIQDRSNRSFLDDNGDALNARSGPYGFYALADYRLAERWATGLRYDFVQPSYIAKATMHNEEAYAGYLTFLQSEFARWRLQYEYVSGADGRDDNRVFLQGTFAIGAHKHQLN